METTGNQTQRTRSPLPEDLATVYTVETELHWQRIVTAVLALLALLTVIGWIMMNAISVEKAAEVINAKPTVETSQNQPDQPAKPAMLQLDEAIPALPVNPQAPASQQTRAGAGAQLEEQPQSAAPGLADKAEPALAQQADAQTDAQTDVKIDMTDDVKSPAVKTADSDKFLDQPGPADAAQITRNPHYVSTLQLTSALDNKSPTDLLEAQITLGGRSLIKIYAYSQLTNLKGEQVFHEWYQGDKRVARIPVGVYLDDMRASSSKYIDQTMSGDWHLDITRANGERLGRMDFRVNVGS